jgi:hypothetical protein
MIRTGLVALTTGLLSISAAAAQTAAWQFRPPVGQVLTYQVEQITSATEVIGGAKTSTTTKVNLVKRWQNLGPEQGKPGTKMVLSLAALRIETTKANGDVLVFDSASPARSTPEMRDQLGRLVGQPLAVVRVDSGGQVVEVIESKHGPATRFESEPPFAVILPGAVPQVGQTWHRDYQITLAPPQGAGEKFQTVQKYECKAVRDGKAVIGLTTQVKNPPESLLDQVPLLQSQPEGEVVFDVRAGRLDRATLKIDKELKDHQGKGSSYHFESLYTEQFVGDR